MKKRQLYDLHVHASEQTTNEELSKFLKDNGETKANILDCYHSTTMVLAPKTLMMKDQEKGRYYSFGTTDYSAYFMNQDNYGEYFVEYFKLLRRCGSDGIKMLEAKPETKKLFPYDDFDDAKWEPLFNYCEKEQIPMLFHANDPEEFWNKDIAPAFAIQMGWLYDDTYPNNEEQYRQLDVVLQRHPNLKICFAHFYFMSRHLDRLGAIFDKYPNVYVDLTPGIEMYENFSNNFEEAKAFFNKYADRIMYGTDIGGRLVGGESEKKKFDYIENRRRGAIVQYFLEQTTPFDVISDGHYVVERPTFTMRPIGLSQEKLEMIYHTNFERFCGEQPAEVNSNAVLELCDVLEKRMNALAQAKKDFVPNFSLIEEAREYFKK